MGNSKVGYMSCLPKLGTQKWALSWLQKEQMPGTETKRSVYLRAIPVSVTKTDTEALRSLRRTEVKCSVYLRALPVSVTKTDTEALRSLRPTEVKCSVYLRALPVYVTMTDTEALSTQGVNQNIVGVYTFGALAWHWPSAAKGRQA
ncbi:hypothetical protein [Phaeodactylibacter luteus]|uniref:Uncharacterized protein n=1 Tax=Phaeodactylibacter luteus TaxID=1564516 RepID=A0A5C6S672_9BACT|nr:hypothetical protein [Phaeodactylibacter luteus]TXB69511.1 hypothetical protein FRY97_01495 [Phaeodactylibacter luteus]